MMMSDRTKRFFKHLGLACVLLFGVPASGALGWAVYLRLSGNVHQIGTSEVYRSAQLSSSGLESVIKDHNIKTVLNLRGSQQNSDWYDAERATATKLGVTHIDLPLSANEEPDDAKLDHLIATMRDTEKPLLIHCEGGADRSGLAAALYRRVINGDSYEKAAEELSFRYGHFPWLTSRTGAMDRAFARRASVTP
ncbi:MAG: dual specificity protein phosphatase family protein [Hyphomicrobiales bacterium]